ncbi:zf-HC2 domain-containing protein [Myceligenerans indicum]|uniref:Putative zinc-finger domain-containing protein n=1 Tax=Myceligenerans indicum TaxID=2593663 RepID=A0ABS1LKG4_9MICO|nr:sigma-70 family RNA polymerase sigma factor [Myceligenerans indicum]MBL0886709.1 hypothetical protein [Myceligenerans indicum]
MTTTDVQIDDWVVHRPNVVRSVAARVPGVDADEAASRALEKMIRIVNNDGEIADPAAYWRRAALNEAYSITREAGRAVPVDDVALSGITPAVTGAELDAEREADVAMLRDALGDLNDDDRKLLFDRHVDDMAVNDIAGDLGVRPHAVTMRLRRAEERLAGAFAAAHARKVNEPECRTTRAAMHDYLKGRLLPRRSKRLEAHLDGCAECTRAFVDVREVSWMLRELGQHLVPIFFGSAAVSSAAAVAGAKTVPGPRRPSGKQTAVAASVLAALALAGGAWAYMATEPDIQAEATPEVTQVAPDEAGNGDGAGDDAADDTTDDADPGSDADDPDTETDEPPATPPEETQPAEEFPPSLDRPAPEKPVEAAPVAEPAPQDDPAPAPEPAPEPGTDGDLDGGSGGDEDDQGDDNGNGGGEDGNDQGDDGEGDAPDEGESGGLGDILGELPLGGLEDILGGLGDVPILGDLINLPLFDGLADALNGTGAVDGLPGD